MDRAVVEADPAWPAGVHRPAAALRGVCAERLLPVVDHAPEESPEEDALVIRGAWEVRVPAPGPLVPPPHPRVRALRPFGRRPNSHTRRRALPPPGSALPRRHTAANHTRSENRGQPRLLR